MTAPTERLIHDSFPFVLPEIFTEAPMLETWVLGTWSLEEPSAAGWKDDTECAVRVPLSILI